MEGQKNIDILQTIYDDVSEIIEGVYAVKLNNKFGIVNNNTGTTLSPEYQNGIYREKYCILGFNRFTANNTQKKSMVYIYLTDKTYNISDIDNAFKEHSALDYRVIEIEDTDQSKIRLIDTETGDILADNIEKSNMQYRPYCDIKFGIKRADGSIIGITRNMKIDTVENILNATYKKVEKIKTKYKVTNNNGRELLLSEYGQEY